MTRLRTALTMSCLLLAVACAGPSGGSSGSGASGSGGANQGASGGNAASNNTRSNNDGTSDNRTKDNRTDPIKRPDLNITTENNQNENAERGCPIRVQFLAWSNINPDTYALRIMDKCRGNRLEIKQIGNPIPLRKVKVKPEKERMVLASESFAQFSFSVAGSPGLKASNGWLIFGQQEGSLLRIGLSNGRETMEIGRVQARPDSATGTFATTTLKTAYWKPDLRGVVVIVNQRNASEDWIMDRDGAHGFKIGR